MSVKGSCHCGGVRIELPSAPEWVADCNCSLCRRLAWRVAYFPPEQVTVSGEDFYLSADGEIWGPERRRSWHLEPGAYSMVVP